MTRVVRDLIKQLEGLLASHDRLALDLDPYQIATAAVVAYFSVRIVGDVNSDGGAGALLDLEHTGREEQRIVDRMTANKKHTRRTRFQIRVPFLFLFLFFS